MDNETRFPMGGSSRSLGGLVAQKIKDPTMRLVCILIGGALAYGGYYAYKHRRKFLK